MYFHNTSFKTILWNCILKIFPLRQFCGTVLLKYFFRATLRSCIPTLPFEAIMHNCILKTFNLRQLSRVVFSHFPFRQFCRILFSKYSLWGNFIEFYSQNISFEATLRSCILKTFHLRQFYGSVFSKYSPLRQFYGIVFSHFLFWDNFVELHSHKCPRTLYPHVNKLMVTKWDVVLALLFIYCINSTNEGHLLTPDFATINFTFLHFSAQKVKW